MDDPKERIKILTTISSLRLVGLAIAPTIGGLVGDAFGWRALFAALAAVGVLLSLLTAILIPETLATKIALDDQRRKARRNARERKKKQKAPLQSDSPTVVVVSPSPPPGENPPPEDVHATAPVPVVEKPPPPPQPSSSTTRPVSSGSLGTSGSCFAAVL